MPTFEDSAADSAEAQQALLGLAHATRRIVDPTQIYEVLGSLSQAAASLCAVSGLLGTSPCW